MHVFPSTQWLFTSPISCFVQSSVLSMFLTCLLLYSLKGLYKGTYTLPKQHKRRSGIRFTVVYFFLSFLFLFFFFFSFFKFINDMWHCYVGSICGDTLQHFSISEHVDRCPSITCPPPSVRAACDQENVCVPLRHRFVCGAHSGCVFFFLFVVVVSVTASQWGEFLYSDQDANHVAFL